MRDTKIVFFDIDGTMIDMDLRKMTDKMIETLHALKSNGVKICVATGRPAIALPHFPGIEFDAFLTFNGSYCYTKEDMIFKNPIPAADVDKLIANANAIQRPVVLAGEKRMGANGADQDLLDYFGISGQSFDIIDDFDELAKEDIYQMMCGGHPHEYDDLLKGVEDATITAWWTRAVDIIPADGGKGLGVEKILSYYGVTKEESLAFGDGTNDIEMLEAVGTGVAMGNATDNVKAIADTICGSCKDDGIYQYCKKYQII